MSYSLEEYRESAAYIMDKLGTVPETALVLGSGLGLVAERMTDVVSLPYENIPHLHKTSVQSHAGRLLAGRLGGRPLLVLSGRFHFYEGYTMAQAAFPMRMLSLCGVKRVILTNAAGGVNEDFSVGDLMLISDHIKLCAESPVRGPNINAFGERFFDMGDAYSANLRALAKEAAQERGVPLQEGVYFYMAGPQFETPAEIRAIRILGGDAVGMSTVTETITAVQCGIEVLGVSCITNLAAGMSGGTLSGEEVVGVGRQAAGRLGDLIEAFLERV